MAERLHAEVHEIDGASELQHVEHALGALEQSAHAGSDEDHLHEESGGMAGARRQVGPPAEAHAPAYDEQHAGTGHDDQHGRRGHQPEHVSSVDHPPTVRTGT